MKNRTLISIIRWMARIIGTIIVTITLLIGIGETLESYKKHGVAASNSFDTLMIITFIFWGIGLAGLIFALWREGLGGFVSLISFIVFFLLIAINPNPDVHFMNTLYIFLIPSVLYIISWWLTNTNSALK
ncbi:hypothetical protein K8354_02340 [Polaribacter litorisediminis]|uniref:DUF7670 domain-containing protein n=1 Tax=Polaribacter litorisediminis TaxID=1908341 RepID=UPI001CC0FF74|nr:hypothetical protein [Polaribacter litorisediminis]UAM98684.1 hypothetical protein K8354_02340 [Polaribacter litorisediminis]